MRCQVMHELLQTVRGFYLDVVRHQQQVVTRHQQHVSFDSHGSM